MDLQRRPQIYLIFFICLFTASCADKKEPDVSHIKVDLSIERFDKELSALQPAQVSAKSPQLKQKYGHFYADFMESILGVGPVADSSYYAQLRAVLNNSDYKELAKEVNSKFPDLNEQQAELTDAFKHIRYYYPETKIPRLISFFSGFSVQTPVGND
jgi:hypothetical protein